MKILLLLLIPALSRGQQHLPDSTIRALKLASNDSSRFASNFNAALYFQEINKDSALFYNEKCLSLAEKNNLKLIMARVLANKGYLLTGKAAYAEALKNLLGAFAIAEDPKNASRRWHPNQKLTGEQSRLFVLALTHHMYGILMKATQNVAQEVFHFKEARRIALIIPNKARVMLAAMNLGQAYLVLKKTDSALVFFNEAKKLSLETGQKGFFGVILAGFGDIALEKGDKAKAKSLYYEGISSAVAANNLVTVTQLYTKLATFYLAEKDGDSSLYFAEKMLQTSGALGMRSSQTANIGTAYEKLYESYKLRGQADSAYKYSRLALAENDSINTIRVENLARFQSLSLKEQLRLQNLEKQKVLYQSRVRIYALLTGLGIFLVIAAILWRNYQRQKRTNLLLHEQKEEIVAQRDNLETKNRDLEIEASLERVRTVAMGMRKPDGLLGICRALFMELPLLQFKDLRNVLIHTYLQSYFIDYDYSDFTKGHISHIPYSGNPTVEKFIQEIRKTRDAFTEIIITGNELKEWKAFRDSNNEAPDERLNSATSLYIYMYSVGDASIGISTFSPILSDDLEVLKRFRNVFDLAYRRYVDITNAEAQAKEAQIELALERVRARTMAMQRSEELAEVAFILFQQFKNLGESPDQATIGIVNEDEWVIEYWVTMYGSQINKVFKFSIDEPHVTHRIYQGWREQQKSLVIDLSGKELYDFTTYRASMGGAAFNPDEKRRVINVAFFTKGLINVQSSEARSEESIRLLERFAGVFEGTYTRFLDLKKAEAQAKEAQIEAALERTRTQSMIMQHSNELDDTLRVFHEQVLHLGIDSAFSFLWLPDEGKDRHIFWAAWAENNSKTFKSKAIDYPLDRSEPATAQCLIDWKGNDPVVAYHVPPEGVEGYFAAWQELIYGVEQLKPEYFGGGLYYVEAFMKYGCFGIMVKNELPEEHKKILTRFAIEFERAYTRFLDLQKSEAQARESQIEAALERVRSRTIAMHNSQDVAATSVTMFQELVKLGVESTVRCGVSIISNKKELEVWTASLKDDGSITLNIGHLDMKAHPLLLHVFTAWQNKDSSTTYELTGDAVRTYFQALNDAPDYHFQYPMDSLPEKWGINAFFFPEGCLFAFTGEPLSLEMSQLFKRFAGVFGQTYRRFLDLQKAEAQAREAQIEAALERVRSRTLAMQKSDELAETAAVLFRQMISLGIEPNRLYIGITREESTEIEFWITDEDGSKVSTMFSGDANKNKSMKKMRDAWEAHKKSIVIDMQGDELTEYFHYLGDILHVPFKRGLTQKRRVQYISYFSNGFIGMASPDEQPEETIKLLERFAGVFNLTFIRFHDLKIAEAHAIQAEQDLILLQTEKRRAEDALTELKSTQTQLVQREKMASLGELTAGIAHEIQNPLNFVNNFSEVSKELMAELIEELDKGDTEEAKAITQDVIENLAKINHHGRRADSIVKGMLEHSRIGTGQKQPTDLNTLTDEFLKLSYHGLRAKDKSFNAELVMHYDAALPKANVVQQDIGRVLLNLFNNAFYAVNQKSKAVGDGYKPEVTISTSSANGHITISVKDNGVGIPDAIKEKILQPFFTTKPTGEGTGLGLSLSYDILVKGHNGTLDIISKEGEGSEFIVKLPVN